MSPASALAALEIFDGVDYQWEFLPGGLTNRNYKIHTEERKFVLRLEGERSRAFGINRAAEFAARRAAAAVGIAPDLLHVDVELGITLSKFVDGHVWTPEHFSKVDNLSAVANLMRRVHQLPLTGFTFDASAVASRYAAALSLNVVSKSDVDQALRLVDESSVEDGDVCCHQDINASNLLTANTLMLLDWEYAADNTRYFDIAALCCFHDLSKFHIEALLKAYFGDLTAEVSTLLDVQMQRFDALQWLWFAVRQTITPVDSTTRRMAEIQRRLR